MGVPQWFNAHLLYPLTERILGRRIRDKVTALRHEFARPFAERRRDAVRKLVAVLSHAGQFVPYYRDLFRKLQFHPERVADDVRRLADLPFLTKDILRRERYRLLDERLPRKSLHVRKTGGSTGPAAEIFYTQDALDWTAACHQWVLEWTGKKRYHREVHLSTRFRQRAPWQDRLREWIKCSALNRWNLCSEALDSAGLEGIAAGLRRVRPFLVQGHPSTLYALALHLQSCPRNRKLFEVFESTGETLAEKQRQTIERVLGCRVFNRYGNAEFGVVAHEESHRTTEPQNTEPQRLSSSDPPSLCSSVPLRLLESIAWPEWTTSSDGTSELVFTGLLNPAMPLIRYRTGDLGTVNEDENGFVLQGLAGRIHDFVTLADRRYPTHYLQDMLDRLGGIDEFQCQQLEEGKLLLRLVVPVANHRPRITAAVQGWWGPKVSVEFTDLGGLKRQGSAGKFRHLLPPPLAA